FAAMLADEAAIRNVVAYIGSLPEKNVESSVHGDAERGARLYRTCSSCHGADGRGIWSTHAPRISGMSDWYMARQLEHFRAGIRGSHPQDFYGAQMTSMARVLSDDRAISDVMQYVQRLGAAEAAQQVARN